VDVSPADRAIVEADTVTEQNWAGARPVLVACGVDTAVEPRRGTRTWERSAVTTELLNRARAGDGDAFRELTDPHRRELQVHCYRMLGSLQDAEDALQDTLLAAWQGIKMFEGRASLRTWLYRVATNRCLNVRRAASRRPPVAAWPVPGVAPIEPSRLGEITWLEPFPDSLLVEINHERGPEARYESTEAISLAFITALQELPPRQRAVLVLRDVLGFHADEVAEMLESTVESVTSALKRARATLAQRLDRDGGRRPPLPRSAEEAELLDRLTRAYETGDVDALIALLTKDVVVAMPPLPLEYHGLELAYRFHHDVVFRDGRTYRLVPTRANGEPAFGVYVRDPAGGLSHALGLMVFTLAGDQIQAITRFDTAMFPYFGLPRSLPS
jgi:RNA polymerase sigma-70 factor (ECF subfamily)